MPDVNIETVTKTYLSMHGDAFVRAVERDGNVVSFSIACQQGDLKVQSDLESLREIRDAINAMLEKFES